jgi:predicted PurR-regulated permease PerM
MLMTLITLAVVGFVLAMVKLGASIINPILLGIYIAALALPIFRRLETRLQKRPLALLATVGVITLGALGLIFILLLSASTLGSSMALYRQQMMQRIEAFFGGAGLPLQSDTVMAAGTFLSDVLNTLVFAMLGTMGSLFFAVMLAALLLLQARQFATLLAGEMSNIPILGDLPETMRTVVRYFGIRTRLNLMTGAGMTIFLLILGIDHAPLWGVLVFFLSFVPYIGLAIAMTPPVLLGFAEHGWVTALLCIVAAAVVNLSIENVVEPNYTGQKLRLSPPIVLVAFFLFVWLLGPLGAALAMPLTVLVVLVSERYAETHWLAQLLTGGKSLKPAASETTAAQAS